MVLRKDKDEKIVSGVKKDFDPRKDITGMARIREVDNEKFVKIYTGNLSHWFELSMPAQKIMQYVIMFLPRNSDVVRLNIARLKTFSGYKSDTSLYDSINELINKRIIAKCDIQELYFINPGYIFNGDRVAFSEVVMRDAQAIGERDKLLGSGNHDQSDYRDEEGRVLEPENVTMSTESLFARASKLYK
jgi:hypothetical protein